MTRTQLYKNEVTKRLTITLPETLLPQIEAKAESLGLSRSAYILRLVAADMGQKLQYNPAAKITAATQ